MFALGAVTATALTLGTVASAYQGDGNQEGRQFNPEHKAAMQKMLESGDYAAFQELVGDHKMGEVIAEENFDKFVEMHNLMKDGDKEGAKAIAEELGLPNKKHMRHFKGKKRGEKFNPEMIGAMKSAFENGDYDTWKEIMGDKKIGEFVTAENFGQFAEMHELMESGDRDGAKVIAEELGLPERPPKKHSMKRMFGGSHFGEKK